MTPPSHVAAGYLVTQAANFFRPDLGFDKPGALLAAVIGANLPDFDVFFVPQLKDHRNTVTHTPIFWIAVNTVIILAAALSKNQNIMTVSVAFVLGVVSHILGDWATARGDGTGGVRLFYPWSKRHFGLRKLEKLPASLLKDFSYKKYLKYYMKDKPLFIGEMSLILIAAAIFIPKIGIYWRYFFK